MQPSGCSITLVAYLLLVNRINLSKCGKLHTIKIIDYADMVPLQDFTFDCNQFACVACKSINQSAVVHIKLSISVLYA